MRRRFAHNFIGNRTGTGQRSGTEWTGRPEPPNQPTAAPSGCSQRRRRRPAVRSQDVGAGEWGTDAAAWVSAGAAVVATLLSIVALVTRREDRVKSAAAESRAQAAEGHAKRAEKRADEALDATKKTAGAVDGIRQLLEPQPPPKVAWEITYDKGDVWQLRNVGTSTAAGIYIRRPDGRDLLGRLPTNFDLPAGHAERLPLFGSMQVSRPTELEISWAGVTDPVVVPVPPKP